MNSDLTKRKAWSKPQLAKIGRLQDVAGNKVINVDGQNQQLNPKDNLPS